MTDLTEKWKKGELESGLYYVGNNKITDIAFVKNNLLEVYTLNSNIPKMLKHDAEIIAKVPTLEELQRLESDRLAKNEGVEFVAELEEENARLKGLLKECKEFFEEENPKDFTIMSERMDDLLTRINAALNESEEHSNMLKNPENFNMSGGNVKENNR